MLQVADAGASTGVAARGHEGRARLALQACKPRVAAAAAAAAAQAMLMLWSVVGARARGAGLALQARQCTNGRLHKAAACALAAAAACRRGVPLSALVEVVYVERPTLMNPHFPALRTETQQAVNAVQPVMPAPYPPTECGRTGGSRSGCAPARGAPLLVVARSSRWAGTATAMELASGAPQSSYDQGVQTGW